jgi:hypothetical protein
MKPLPLRLSPSALVPLGIVLCLALSLGLAQVYGRGVFFLGLAAMALFGAIGFFWRSMHGLTESAPLSLEEALSLGAPSREEERKQSVLRILKDLEYERAVGKIAEADFQELSQRYRAEAALLLSSLDQELGPARERAEALLRERLATEQKGDT